VQPDSADPRFGVVAQLVRLWDPLTGQPLAVVPFAVEAPPDTNAARGVMTAPLLFSLRTRDSVRGRWSDTTFSRNVSLPRGADAAWHYGSYVAIPWSPTITDWSLTVLGSDETHGGAYYEGVAPLVKTGALTLSDIVLGNLDDSVGVSLRGQRIVLAPRGLVSRNSPAAVYYQVFAASAVHGATTTLKLYAGQSANAELALTLPAMDLVAGTNVFVRKIDLAALHAGRFRAELLLTDPRGQILARRSVPIDLQ
jgi:hypothetical protein